MLAGFLSLLWQFASPLYVAGLYGASRIASLRGNLRQAVVIDALMLNWFACEVARQTIPGAQLPAAYLCADISSALWLSLRVRGLCAGVAEIFYIALIMFNSAFFFARAFDEWTHWLGLSILSWGQLMLVTGGIVRHDLAKIARGAAAHFGLQRYLAFGNREAGE